MPTTRNDVRSFQLVRAGRCGAMVVTAVLVATGLARANEPLPVSSPPTVERRGDTPRNMMRAFLRAGRQGDWARAATYLDVPEGSPHRAPVLARRLQAVLDRTGWVDIDALSDSPQGDLEDGLPPNRERIGRIDASHGPVDLMLARVELPDGAAQWKITAATVARVPGLYQQFGPSPLGALLPPMFSEVRVLDVELWQWLGLLVLSSIAAALGWVLGRLITRSSRVLLQRAGLDGSIVNVAAGPITLLLGALVFAVGSHALALALAPQNAVDRATVLFGIIAVTWLVVRLTDLLAAVIERRFVARAQIVAVSVVPLGRRSVKAFVVLIAGIIVLQNLGLDVTGLLAGLGIGGLAIALAAQKTVENLFGGITLITDQPVRVGDFCRFGDQLGTVEEVGLRSTRVRTLDRTVVSIPNGQFSAMALENFARRDRIWLRTTLGFRYETTPDQLRYLLIELKRLLLAHPKIHPDPARVRFVGFGAYSIDVEIFAYVRTADINEFHAVREDVFLRIMDLVAASGTGFAFPSQTIYTRSDVGLDDARGRTAEEQVRRWREETRLCLPDVPSGMVAEIAGTLDYPPNGSARP